MREVYVGKGAGFSAHMDEKRIASSREEMLLNMM